MAVLRNHNWHHCPFLVFNLHVQCKYIMHFDISIHCQLDDLIFLSSAHPCCSKVKPCFTDTHLIRTPHYYELLALSLGKESPYNLSKLNWLNTDTFYGPLSVCINQVWLYFWWILRGTPLSQYVSRLVWNTIVRQRRVSN